jgi:hypothetical protein
VWGTTATIDELTGDFGSALEDKSIGDCRLVAHFAEKSLQAIFGVLQHYQGQSGSLTSGPSGPFLIGKEQHWQGLYGVVPRNPRQSQSKEEKGENNSAHSSVAHVFTQPRPDCDIEPINGVVDCRSPERRTGLNINIRWARD